MSREVWVVLKCVRRLGWPGAWASEYDGSSFLGCELFCCLLVILRVVISVFRFFGASCDCLSSVLHFPLIFFLGIGVS